MLAFIDESGDTGLKTNRGSSQYFVIAIALFDKNSEALACDQRIESLKHELRIKSYQEFKFSKSSKKQRVAFLETVRKYSFSYYGVVINKDPKKLYGVGFKVKESFYKYASSLVFENAKSQLKHATVVIDGSGSREFKKQFTTYLKKKVGSKLIKKVKIQDSRKNNLIQLADMVVGAIHRSFSVKDDKGLYRKMLRKREKIVQVWPK